MQSPTYKQLLDRAAKLWGIEPEFWDIFGKLHVTSDEVKRLLLAGQGVDAASELGLEHALERHYRKEWTRLAPPCLVTGNQQPVEFLVNVPEESADEIAAVEVRCEDGRVRTFDLP